MILYASHLLNQIKERGKKYDLLVNLLNGSAEIGLAIQSIDHLLETSSIKSTTIFEVDFARYSRKDRKHRDVVTYTEFEKIALPKQLQKTFRSKVENKDVLIVDDNLNTGKSLYNVKISLEEIAKHVDLSTIEITPLERVIALVKRDNPTINSHTEIKLVETNLTYAAIGWWRDQVEMNEERRIERIISSK